MSNEVEREAYHKWKSGAEPYGFNGFTAFQAGAEWQRTQSQPADALVEALDALIADYDGEIHNEYDGTSMLDSRLSEINYAREALAAYRAAMEGSKGE